MFLYQNHLVSTIKILKGKGEKNKVVCLSWTSFDAKKLLDIYHGSKITTTVNFSQKIKQTKYSHLESCPAMLDLYLWWALAPDR